MQERCPLPKVSVVGKGGFQKVQRPNWPSSLQPRSNLVPFVWPLGNVVSTKWRPYSSLFRVRWRLCSSCKIRCLFLLNTTGLRSAPVFIFQWITVYLHFVFELIFPRSVSSGAQAPWAGKEASVENEWRKPLIWGEILHVTNMNYILFFSYFWLFWTCIDELLEYFDDTVGFAELLKSVLFARDTPITVIFFYSQNAAG